MNRNKIKTAMVLLAFVVVSACATTPPKTNTRSVKTGESVELVSFGFWNGDCSPKYFNLKVEKQPDHGTVEIVKSSIKIPDNPAIGTSSSKCSGRDVEGKALNYIANDEFTGIDVVKLSVQAPGLAGWQRYVSTVNVTKK